MRLLLLSLTLAVTGGNAACSCTADGVAGTYTNQCLDDMNVVACNSGKINVSLSATPGDTAVFDKATCVHGIWFGTTCTGAGHAWLISATTPFFNCPDVVPPPPTTTPAPTTTPTVPTVPTTTPAAPVITPCTCAYTDAGAAENLAAPVSFCTNAKQVLQCDGKISAMNANVFVEYDSVSCTGGSWSATGCDGVPVALNSASVTVKCGTKEPPLCPQIPNRDRLKYIGTENGMQRYTCEGDELVKHTVPGDNTLHAKYVECNATNYFVKSDDVGAWYELTTIEKITCRDYGKIAPACFTPFYRNAWLHDGKLQCIKGTYLYSIIIRANKLQMQLNVTEYQITSATCDANGWTIPGTPYTGVELSWIGCGDTPKSVGTCGALDVARRNVQFSPFGNPSYYCWDALGVPGVEGLEVVISGSTFGGFQLQCVAGEWKLIGISPIDGSVMTPGMTVPAGSKVSCKAGVGVFPAFPASLPLVPVSTGTTGFTKWACIDSTVKIDLEYQPEFGGRQPVHTPYIETNGTYFRFVSSQGSISTLPEKTISSISCEDMGSKHAACADLIENGGIRRGNRYECLKGFFLREVYWKNAAGAIQRFNTNATDSKSLRCERDGWHIEGSTLADPSIFNLWCLEAHPDTSDTPCAAGQSIDAVRQTLQWDAFRKYFTCYAGESLGYTLVNGGVRTYGAGKKMYCGKNAATNADEWQWSLMDGTEASPIPLGAKMTCF